MNFNPKNVIDQHFSESARVKLDTGHLAYADISDGAKMIADCFRDRGKVLICGNGGSAADSQHLAAELVSRYGKKIRKALPAIALTTDSSMITAHSNDFMFEDVFDRQIQALGNKGDVLVAFSTSGGSMNVLRAILRAHSNEMKVVGLCGATGFMQGYEPDIQIKAASNVTAHIQEVHVTTYHVICELVEKMLFDF